MLKPEDVKKFAKGCGADLVGIASIDRFDGAPKNMDPRYINPDARSLIVLGFRILRGCLRGIEEGTFFVVYSSMGYAAINSIYAPMTLWNLCKAIEDEGYEATPIPNHFYWTGAGRPVSEDKPAPDVYIHYRIAAFCAGLGEIGYSKLFLTPEFGPRQRFAAVLTTAPLEPDPLFEGEICDRCMLCVKDCTVGAISGTETVKVNVAGRELEWGKLDVSKCSKGFSGGNEEFNPFFGKGPEGTGPAPVFEYGRALEGARGCMRACMIHLEEQGKIKNAFKDPFRVRKPWRMS